MSLVSGYEFCHQVMNLLVLDVDPRMTRINISFETRNYQTLSDIVESSVARRGLL